MGQLNQQLANLEDASENLQNCEIVKSKYQLYQICFEKLGQYITMSDNRLGSILQDLYNVHTSTVNDLSDIIGNMQTGGYMQNQLYEAAQKLENENHLQKQIKSIIQLLQNLTSENNFLREELEALRQELNHVKEENKTYLDKIVKSSKSLQFEKSQNKTEQSQNQSSGPRFNETQIQSFHQQSEIIKSTTVRTLTLKQLKDLIEEIFHSKQKHDVKQVESNLPRETMEQHMYTFLNQKYGLKQLTIEWATALINGIKRYSSQDNIVAVFGKILRNECDEEYRYVQIQIQETTFKLMKMYLCGKYKYQNQSEIKKMIDLRVNGKIHLEECQDIIKFMYNEEDSEIILQKLDRVHQQTINKLQDQSDKKLSREQIIINKQKQQNDPASIEFNLFQKVILDFQLKSHEVFLAPFIKLFNSVDTDNNGIIDEVEFNQLIDQLNMDISKEEVDRYLQILDPSNNNIITFSKLILLFSQEILQGQETPILQKISEGI